MEHVTDEELESLVPTDAERIKMELELTNETDAQMAQRIFKEHAVLAAQAIVTIAVHGATERMQFQAATYVVDRVLGRIQDNPPKADADPYELLVSEVVRYVEQAATSPTSSTATDVPNTSLEGDTPDA
jgi:hemin uptake protein HemP